MDQETLKKTLEEIKKQPKRKFSQSYDLIINLKNIVIKQDPVDFFVTLNHSKGREIKVAAFVDQQLFEQASKYCDLAVHEKDFEKYKEDKKLQKKLAEEYDYFIAQAPLMAKIAATFGKVLGVKGKMPNPKLGCVVPPTASLEPLAKRLRTTVRVVAKKGTNLQCMIGKEGQAEEEIIDNILNIYNALIKHLPNETQNIKNVLLKLTMGKPVRVV